MDHTVLCPVPGLEGGVSKVFCRNGSAGSAEQKKLLLGENAREVDFDKKKIQALTFALWADAYLEKYAKEKRSTVEDKRHVSILKEFFGNLLLFQITHEKIEAFKEVRKDRLTWRRQPVSDAYCNRELACLRHILKLAVEKELLERVPTVRLHKEDNARDITVSEEEYEKLLGVAPPHLQRIIICGYETGMRAGEIAGLTWDKVDLKNGLIRLSAEDTKTKQKRIIPISPTLHATFDAIRRDQRTGKISPIGGQVFTWQEKRLNSQGWKRSWGTACKKAGIEELRFHDLRHTFVTRKVREGWDYKRTMAITGHKTFSVFQRYNNPFRGRYQGSYARYATQESD